jgi:hypothetical protein
MWFRAASYEIPAGPADWMRYNQTLPLQLTHHRRVHNCFSKAGKFAKAWETGNNCPTRGCNSLPFRESSFHIRIEKYCGLTVNSAT